MASLSTGGVGTIIQPPKLTPPRVSLLTAAEVIDGDASRWESGYAYSPDGCGEGNVATICPSPGYVKTTCDAPTIVEFQPFYVYASDKCSTWSFKDRDFYERAVRKLLASESWFIENQFMTDSLGLGNHPVINPSATVVTAGAMDPHVSLALLEQGIADCMRGGRAMIHVRPETLVHLVFNASVRREGNVWLTAMDNIIVAGRGYPGTGPAGQAVTPTSAWMYATAMVQVRRGPIVLTPTPEAEATEQNPNRIPREAIDRQHNDIFVLAERIVSVAHDPTCCVLAAEVVRGVA